MYVRQTDRQTDRQGKRKGECVLVFVGACETQTHRHTHTHTHTHQYARLMPCARREEGREGAAVEGGGEGVEALVTTSRANDQRLLNGISRGSSGMRVTTPSLHAREAEKGSAMTTDRRRSAANPAESARLGFFFTMRIMRRYCRLTLTQHPPTSP